MSSQSFKRKLSAILSADVKGYSQLMSEDEEHTIRTLTGYRELMSELIQKRRGRVVDSPGDNILAEFASIVDAVQCAVDIQRELKIKNAELAETRKMEFRIGINLGDVVEEKDRIYGDGVNIAARLESLAEAGGICVSGNVYEQIENKIAVGYEYLGEQAVKNIPKPVPVYRIITDPEASDKVIGAKRIRSKRLQWMVVSAVVIVVGIAAATIWNIYFYVGSPERKIASISKPAIPLSEKGLYCCAAFQKSERRSGTGVF
jgi:adenylate cyclase